MDLSSSSIMAGGGGCAHDSSCKEALDALKEASFCWELLLLLLLELLDLIPLLLLLLLEPLDISLRVLLSLLLEPPSSESLIVAIDTSPESQEYPLLSFFSRKDDLPSALSDRSVYDDTLLANEDADKNPRISMIPTIRRRKECTVFVWVLVVSSP